MKSWVKVVSKFLLALLVIDSITTTAVALSETTSEEAMIRDTYLKSYQEDTTKLSLTIDKEQTNSEQLAVKLKVAEGVIDEQGLTLILQSGLALGQNDQGQDILPEGFYRDEAYNENDRKVAAAGSDALAAGLEQLPVYGEGYYSLKIKPSADRSITLNTDPSDSSKRFEEHVFIFKKVSEVQTGEMVAMTNEHYLTILKENQSVFTNQETTEINASTEIPRGPGSITIQLRAYEENNPDPQVPLTESEFEISSVAHPEQTMKGKTDLNGNVTFENIALGSYTIKQLTSNSDYTIAEQIETVELTEAETTKTVGVTNTERQSGGISRSSRSRRAVTEATSNSTTTTVTNADGTTTTYTREESIFKYIFKPITISIPGFYQSYSQDGVLKKKEVVVDSATNTTKIIWEYTTTVGGANSNITSIRNAFSTTTDSGLGEPRITSVTKNGTPITTNTTYFGSSDNFKSATDNLPVENGTYVYTIETPVVIPSDNYSLDYRSEVTVNAPKGSKLTYNGTSVTLDQDEIRTLSTADTITLPAQQDGGVLGDLKVETVNTSNVNRTIGKYRDGNDRVIEWTSSQLNDTKDSQTFTFDVALDSSQAVHEYKVYIYEPSNGTYTETRAETVTPTGNQITVSNVPAGAIALVKTVTNVTNEKVNHTISGAQLEALKGDIKIQKNWVNGATPVNTSFTITGGTVNQTKTLSAGQTTITVNDVPKFSGTGATATKKRIHYEVNETVPTGYILASATFDLESLTYLFNNKKDESSSTLPGPPGTPTNYGITSVEPLDINYIKYQSGSTVWGGFSGSLKLGFKIPPYAQEGDSFTVQIPEELKLDHPANPNQEWTPVLDNQGREIAKVYHTKDREVKFVLTKNAYSVSEYSGWYTIGSSAGNIIQKNNDTSFRGPYLTGVAPVLPKWYEWENTRSTLLTKQLNFTGSYSGGSFSYDNKTISTTGTLNATNNGSSQGDLHEFDGVNKYEYEQGEDYITWDLMFNTGGGNADYGVLADRHKFWDYIHEGMALYSDGNVASSIPKDIEFFIADGTAAASYANPVKMTLKGTSTTNGTTQYHYEVKGTNIGVAVFIKPEVNSNPGFDNFRSTHTLEFYYENIGNKTIVARIKMRKVRITNTYYYYNGAMRAYNDGVGGARYIYRRAAETSARGGAIPTDWYSLKLKKVGIENGQKKALEGAAFTLYDANKKPYQTVRSNANGEFTFSELLAGTYTFKEISAPPGYILDPTEHTIVVTNSQNITIDGKQYDANNPTEVVNTKPTTLQINKFELGESQPLKGAVFRLQSKNGGNYDITIGNDIPASQFVFANLTKGTYTLTETKAPAGYKPITPLDIEVYEENGELKIRKLTDLSNTQTGAIEVVNGNFSIDVVDEDFSTEFTKVNEQGQPLADAVFELRQMTQTGYKRVLTGLTSNSQGKLHVDHLQGGTTYELWETSAPSGYSKPTTAVARFTVSDTGAITFASGSSQIINRPPTYKVKVQKVDALTGQKVTVQTRIGITDSQGHVIEGQISNFTNGEVSFPKNFAPGTYYIKEETTPSGYIGLSGLVPFTIRADGVVEVSSDYLEGIDVTTSSPDTITIKVKNYPLGKFKVSKRVKGISDMTNLITGQMTFTLTKNDDPNVTIVKQQAANQDFVFENLQPGVYTLTETQAPSGYIKSTETYTIHVDRDGSVRFYPNSDTSSHLATGLRVIKSAEIAAAATHGSSTEDKALDGTLTTGALYRLPNSTLNEGQWWGVDLGSVQRVTQILFAQGKNATDGSDRDKMDSYTLEYSSDGITYQSLGDFTTLDLTQSVDIYARYIRVRNLQTGTGRWLGIRDLQVSVRDATQTIDAGGSNDTANIIKIGNIENPEFKIEKVDSNNTQISKPVIFKLYKVDDSTTADTVSSVTLNDSNLVQTLTFTGQSSMTRLTATALGKYVLVEAQAPEGYDGLTAPVLLELEETTRAYDVTQQKAVTRFRVLSQTNSVSVTDLPAVSGVLANAISIKVKNTLKSYNLKIVKKDLTTDSGLNARFELYNENESTKLDQGNTTQTGNSLTFRNLQPGIYVLKEVTPPSGYIQVDPVRLEITQAGQLRILSGDTELLQIGASSSNTLQLTVKNDSKKTLRISKRIKGLEDLPSLITGEMTFTLTKDNDATAVSAVQTHAATEDFVFTNLTYGSYTLVETAPPAGYMVEPITYKVSVSRSGVSLYKVANAAPIERVTGATLIKSPDLSNIQSGQDRDAIDGSETTSVTYKNFNGQGDNIPAGAYLGVDLQGVKRVRHIHYLQGTQRNAHDRFNRFTLEYSIDGRTYFPLSTYTEHGLVDLNTDIVARYIRVRNEDRVEQKWYGVRELRISAQEAVSVSLQGGQTFPIGNIQHPEIQIEKQDMNNSIIQQAVTFKLYKVPDDATSQTVTGALTDQNFVQTFTLTNGQVRQTLEAKVLGRYALVEVAPPTGYRALAGPVLLDLTTAQETHSGSQMKTVSRFTLVGTNDKVRIDTATENVLKIFVKNELLTYNLLIKKRDLANPNTGLDARFELYDENETRPPLGQGNTTQAENSLTFRNLQPGTYVLKEITAPTGYNPIQKIKLTISLDGQIRIVEGPQDLLESQAVNANNEIELVVKNRPFTDFSIEKVSNLTPTINLAGVQLQIKAKNNGPAPLFSNDDWHRQRYQAAIDTANKSLTWWTQSNDVGNAVFKLPQGTYTISELAAPAGYELLQPFDIIVGEDGQVRLADGAPTNAEINTKDNRLNLKLTNIFKPKLKIIKVDSRDENRKLENATFKLFGGDGRTQVGSDLVTGTTGEVEIPALTPGTYYLQETQSPAGFQTNGTKYKLIIAADGTTTVENGDDLIAVAPLSTDKVIQITVKNKVKTYRLKVKKRDYDNPTNGVSGARFALYPSEGPNADGSNMVQVLINGSMTALVGNSYSHVDNNTINFPNIPPGEYVLREIQAPSGYTKIRDTRLQIGEDGRLTLLDADQAFVSVETGQGDTLVMVAKNIRTFNFQIKKVDSTNEATLLDNARFSIYKTDVNWTKGDTALAQGLTSAGIYQTNLEPGYYILKEDQAPSGYLLNRNEYRFQINHDGSILLHNPDATVSLARADSNRVVVFTMKNTRTTSQFKLAKRSYRDSAQRLEATFELKESGNAQAIAVVKTTTTTGDEVLFDNLPVGKSYILKETVAPDGYQKIEKEIHIDIGADGAITIRDGGDLVSLDNTDSHLIIVKNLRKGEYPKTGGIGIIPYIALGGVMMLVALAVELRRKNII
ncbi:SpaA isopeptide-forming pilin-related protein [Streptococcus suis]|uniref:SpaA isopeptide-forming pilin-related protein n=1 Tax=Streptococcus suis TaxID=1307 RepID=UPI0021BC078C|nr:SpaA isopeptide-forming pilin-related protein [Streptococcus suis]